MEKIKIEYEWSKAEGLPFHYHEEYGGEKGLRVSPHMHETVEILYCQKGSGLAVIGQTEYLFQEGDMIVAGPQTVHSVLFEHNCRYQVVRFLTEVLHTAEDSVIEPKYIMPFVRQNITKSNRFTREELENTEVPGIFGQIAKEYTGQRYGYELALRACAQQLFLYIIRAWNERSVLGEEASGKWGSAMKTVQDYVWQHYDEDISPMEMASLCHISYGHFSVIFKQMTGCSFVQYLNNVRMMRSKKMLLNTDAPITQIAQEVGFLSTSYYIKLFRQIEGISPYQYRKLNR